MHYVMHYVMHYAMHYVMHENDRHEKLLAKERERAAKAKEALKGSTAERGELEAQLAAAAAAAVTKESRCEELKRMLGAAEARAAATSDGQAQRRQRHTHCTHSAAHTLHRHCIGTA